MAESASTGNSGTSTTGTSSTSSTSTSTSTSTSNGGAASGSQTSSNGSSSTGKSSGNSNNGTTGLGPGLSFSAGVTSNSNGNFSGGLPGMAPGFTGFAASNFGQGWGNGSSGSSTNGTKTEPVMTVDEVYGKGNQSIVESQGDYEASSNEKSNVETSTFGKQDEISVTPLSVTEDKGLVNNDAIQSVEGLNFQQKDKANQEVMEAKKSRDEAEAEDNANGMRNQLKAVAEKDAEETETDAFQVGEKNTFEEQDKAKLAELNQRNQELEAAKKEEPEAIAAAEKAEEEAKAAKLAAEKARDEANHVMLMANEALRDFMFVANTGRARESMDSIAKDYDIDVGDVSTFLSRQDLKGAVDAIDNTMKARVQEAQDAATKAQETAKTARTHANEVTAKVQELQTAYEKANQEYNTWKTEYWTNAEKTKAEEEAAAKAKAEETPTTEAPAYKGIIDAAKNEITNAKDLTDEQKSEVLSVLGNVESAKDAMKDAANEYAANPNDINAALRYAEETGRYNKALKDAKGDKTLKNTDYNKTFTRAVAAANDFMVTREDGTQQNYAEFAAEMAVKSPEIAAGMYKVRAEEYANKAKELEDNGKKGIRSVAYKALAKIENAKSKMVMTWLGSKFTFADNQVRNQFNQMAKTDMRATYAAYNNVLDDETGKYSDDYKAEASAAINQANALMRASAALQATTGFFSGIGDGTSDGEYGKTDPGKLNTYQKALNIASNFAKITLCLGVTPGANEAYQNMYYMAGDKVKNSMLFGRDFDGDGFALCQEYGNNATVGMIAGAGELATAVALFFNPATSKLGINLAIDSIKTFLDGLYGVQKEVNKSIKYSNEILSYFNEAKSIAAETGNKEVPAMWSAG